MQQLQGSMRDIIQCMSVLYKIPNNNQNESSASGIDEKKSDVRDSSGTQTEIIAVHTPQVENLPFPFINKLPRPSTLSLADSNGTASSIRKISENNVDENAECEKKLNENDGESSASKRDETPEITAKNENKEENSEKMAN